MAGQLQQVSDPANCVTAGYECSYTPRADATQNTGHCFYNRRVRTRIDYGAGSTAGGCNTTSQRCFNVVSRAYPLTGLDVVPGLGAANWEGSGLGLDQWAIDASGYTAGGSGGCGVEGTTVTDTGDQLARSWEYAVRKQTGDSHFDAAGVMAKAWEDCTHGSRCRGPVPDLRALGQGLRRLYVLLDQLRCGRWCSGPGARHEHAGDDDADDAANHEQIPRSRDLTARPVQQHESGVPSSPSVS